VIGIEKILITVVMVIIFLVALREKWHNGSKAKHEAKKAKIETRYLEHKLKCIATLTNKPTRRRAKFMQTFRQHKERGRP